MVLHSINSHIRERLVFGYETLSLYKVLAEIQIEY